jgi:hypothetical protein
MEAEPREIVPIVSPLYKRITTWDAAGNPVLIVQPVLNKPQMRSIYFVVAAQPFAFDDPRPDAEKYEGMTTVEILIRKQIESAIKSGDVAAIETVMDRLIDRPLSRSENLNVDASYEDVLKEIRARSHAQVPAPIDVPDSSIFGDLA